MFVYFITFHQKLPLKLKVGNFQVPSRPPSRHFKKHRMLMERRNQPSFKDSGRGKVKARSFIISPDIIREE